MLGHGGVLDRRAVPYPGCGTVVSFGRGDDGQLGHGDADERSKPTAITTLNGAEIDEVICGAEHSVALSKRQNEVYSWGWCVAASACHAA
jgi:alpha-tubulin suppressor-like RCC1 family protein